MEIMDLYTAALIRLASMLQCTNYVAMGSNPDQDLRLFADDSILYKTIKDESDTHKLQEDLDAAAKWENDWLMQSHPDKCSITTKKNPMHHKYVLHQHTLQTESSTKYLGVTIRSDLKWNKLIDNISSTASKHLSFIKRNLKVYSKSVKEKAYTSLLRPKLEYSLGPSYQI
jgi:myo-inositol-hexaphosphate 3-phosphohydrolase